MHRLGWTSLFVLLCSGLVNACEASGDVLTRQVQLGKHLVETRALKEGSSENGEQGSTLGRVLSSSTHGAPVVFLLGYEPSMKAAVTSALTSMGASILQNLPKSDHWLVRSTPANIHSLQQQFPTVTSSVLPKHAKISDSADRIVREMGQARQASPHVHSKAHPGRVLHGAGGTDGSEPAWLKELKHSRSKDGHTHIVLSVDRPAFTTVKSAYCSECPERAEAKREAEAWAQGMKEGLAAELSQKPGDACNPIIEGYTLIGTLRLIVCLEQAEDALSWLAEQGEVVSVAFEHVLKPMNLHASRAIQSGAFSSPLPDNFASDGTRESLFPHWAAGITGEGQIVGVSDTGIDMGSCYFWDPSFADYQTNSDNIKKTDDSDGVSFEHFANANHRKVVSYFWFRDADKDDDAAGHGTHVAGTVAGSPYNFDPVTSPDLATGVAPRARVSFFDIAEGDLGTIITPGDCVDSSCSGEAKGSETSIFEVQRKEGARIATNSWGTSNYDYSSFCRNLDAWLWENDMLILFSAGNQGVDHDPEGATGKVGSPATCKNVLAIGATGNFFNTSSMPDGGTEDRLIDDNGNQIQVSNITDKFVNNEGLLFYLLDSNGAKTQVNKTYFRDFSYFAWNEEIVSTLGIGQERELMLADPLDACSSLNGDYSNKVVVFDEGGSCSLSTKANNVKATGAVAGILLDSDPTLNTDETVTGLPFITVFSNPSFFSFYEIFFGLDSGSRYSLVTAGNSPHDYITDFSSYGSSSQDAYILPKLTAPGIMLSAGTDGNYNAAQSQCTPQVSKKQGTSMACPAAAGAAALARQYFMDGFYPTGSKVPENAMEPTASLLTAVLVAGASAMQGLAIRDGSNLQLYDEYEGYGRVNLYRSLPIDGVTSSGWNLQVWQKETLFIAGETKRYNVGATGGSSLILSLAWMDLPATSTGGEPALINDLDLKVTAPDGSVLWGNGRTNGDRANNIEKVVIDSPQSGEYVVEVTAVSIDTLEGPQSFSVVALGGVNAAATDKVGPPPPPFPSPPPPSPAPPPPSPSPPPSPPSPPPSPFPPPTPPASPSPPPSPPQPPSPYPPPPAPLPPPPSPSPSPTLVPNPGEEFTDNERQVDIDFGMALTGDQLEDLRDEASALYQTFRDETTTFLANELGEGSRVTLITLIIPSDVNRRSLLQTVDVTGRYLFQTPEGTSAEETRSRTNTIISRLNEDDGAEYLTSNTNLGSLNIQNIDAQDTTPSSDSGAQRVGGAAVLRAALMAMGAALLLAL